MLTRNYWGLKGYIDKTPYVYRQANIDVDMGLVDIVGDRFSVRVRSSGARADSDMDQNGNGMGANCLFAIKYNLNVRVGSGTTEPTANDYKLESDETSNFIYFKYYSFESAYGNSTKTIFNVSGINSLSKNIVISEIGITKTKIRDSVSGSYQKEILLLRALLENPITVGPKEGFTLPFEWTEQ